MARKKEFDPLGGSVGGDKPKKAKKNNTILGSKGYAGSSSVYDEVEYAPRSDGYTDALTASGASDKPRKRGLFSGIFGQKKSPRASDPSRKSEYKSDFPIIDDSVIPDTEKNYHTVTDIREDDIFEEEPLDLTEQAIPNAEPFEEPYPKSQNFVTDQPEIKKSAKEPTHFFVEDKQKKQTVKYHPTVCYLCGADSAVPHQQFRFGSESDTENTIPLCKTCMRAVTTLMKYRDPADEREIKSEWRFLSPGLDEKRADEIISEGRRNY